MKFFSTIGSAAVLVVLVLSATNVLAQDSWYDALSSPQEAMVPAAPEAAEVLAQPMAQAVSPQGQWIDTAEYGLVWVPAGSTATVIAEEPYVYLYTPAYGWTWYASPWGPGPFQYGAWLHRPWAWQYAPRVWGGRTWFAPHVYGGGHTGGSRGSYHGGYRGDHR